MTATKGGPGDDRSPKRKHAQDHAAAQRVEPARDQVEARQAPQAGLSSGSNQRSAEPVSFFREPAERTRRHWPLVLGLVVIVSAIYASRLTTLPIRGEEPRRARVAMEILDSGDWIVPRQQGQIYTSRPPLQNAAIAAVGYLHGGVDRLAARLPSVLALLATTLLIYAYAIRFLSPQAAFVAALAYPTMGQVLEIGRSAETEAFFTFFVSGSLLVWHWGMSRITAASTTWEKIWPWVAGYALAALASLTKGAQGTVYFIGSVVVYLTLTRDWKNLFSRAHACGAVAFALVLGAWQVPYFLATNAQSVQGIWTGLAAERYVNNTPGAVTSHLLGYPWEVLACMLPWSLLLAAFAFRSFRRAVAPYRAQVLFLATCIAVTFLPVWVATHAKSRYYMPIYPLFAVLVGIAVDRITAVAELNWLWRNYVRGVATVAAIAAVCVAGASCIPLGSLAPLAQPRTLVVFLLWACGLTAMLAWRHSAWHESQRVVFASCAIAGLLGLFTTGVHTNMLLHVLSDPGPEIIAAKAKLPAQARVVSFGRLDSMLTYHYGDLIAVVDWPRESGELPADADYFCFNCPADELPNLPFEYRVQASVPWGRSTNGVKESLFVIGQKVPDVAGKSIVERQ